MAKVMLDIEVHDEHGEGVVATLRPYIAWGRNQFRIGVRYHLDADPPWLWRFKFLGIERGW